MMKIYFRETIYRGGSKKMDYSAYSQTVKDVLQLPQLKKGRVVAGCKGLNNVVYWVHIHESMEIEVGEDGANLNGNELILSSDVEWGRNESLGLTFLELLIAKNVSGLCIKLGSYISSIPQRMIDFANENDFPIIIVPQKVRFIDITQESNNLYIGTQYKKMSDLDKYSEQLSNLLLSTGGFIGILKLLHKYLNVQVIYKSVGEEVQFFPEIKKDKEKLLSTISSETTTQSIASKPVQALGYKFADLIILSPRKDWTEFEYSILDKTATALSQDQLRMLYMKEKQKYQQENRWTDKWLKGEHSQEEVEQYLSSIDPTLKTNGCVACVCKLYLTDQQMDFTYYSMICSSLFEQQGFFSLVTFERNYMIFALVNQREKNDWKARLKCAIEQINQTKLIGSETSELISFGIGKLLGELGSLSESYRMSKESLYIQEQTGQTEKLFYEDFHIYRMISKLHKAGVLQDLIIDYIGPILEFDEKNDSNMFETLQVFLEVNGSKQEAARRLFFARQTLYYRIEKLEELLGNDFMQPDKRLAIETALYAYKFVGSKNDKEINSPIKMK